MVMPDIIKTLFGDMVDPKRVAQGSASPITKSGPFYNFSIRVDANDVREYSFTNRERAENMRQVLIGHLEEKIKKNFRSTNSR
jgi:hypothetical protein